MVAQLPSLTCYYTREYMVAGLYLGGIANMLPKARTLPQRPVLDDHTFLIRFASPKLEAPPAPLLQEIKKLSTTWREDLGNPNPVRSLQCQHQRVSVAGVAVNYFVIMGKVRMTRALETIEFGRQLAQLLADTLKVGHVAIFLKQGVIYIRGPVPEAKPTNYVPVEPPSPHIFN
jgi:hypothetical protein